MYPDILHHSDPFTFKYVPVINSSGEGIKETGSGGGAPGFESLSGRSTE